MTETSNRKTALTTRIAQALHFVEAETGAVVPAIQPTSTYARDEAYETRKDYLYRRDGGQTTQHAEAIIAELEKRGITVSSPQVSIVLKKLGLRSSRGRKAGAGRKAAPTAKQPVVAASSNAAISIDDILAAKKAAAQLGGTDRALAALAALKRIES